MTVDSVPYKINNYSYNLFSLTSSHVNENTGYSLICDHIRQVYNNCLEEAEQFLEEKKLANDLPNGTQSCLRRWDDLEASVLPLG